MATCDCCGFNSDDYDTIDEFSFCRPCISSGKTGAYLSLHEVNLDESENEESR